MVAIEVKQAGPERRQDIERGMCVIGVDFDNTIVTYDDLLYELALKSGLIDEGVERSKKVIRDCVRLLPDGEIQWQKLQALAYGPKIKEARPAAGVRLFFELCRQNKIKTYIISHKTEFAGCDETGTNLREAAIDWLKASKFFDRPSEGGLGLPLKSVFFGAERSEKIALIKQLGCTHFIDDLEETFSEAAFPADVKKILLASRGSVSPPAGVFIVNSWDEIKQYFFSGEAEKWA